MSYVVTANIYFHHSWQFLVYKIDTSSVCSDVKEKSFTLENFSDVNKGINQLNFFSSSFDTQYTPF